jgi:Phytanoyl-CoA dioxygenase (PhyH)
MSQLRFLAPSEHLTAKFAEQGYLLVKGFYDYDSEIRPIQEGICKIVELVARKYQIDTPIPASPEEAMTQTYPAIIAANRKYGSEIYDAVKQIPTFWTLVGQPRNSELFIALRPNSVPGIASGGAGIRIDNPGEEKYRATWHQEFPAQLRSLDGVVFWSPLLPVVREMGPVELCPGSHKSGPIPVYEDDGGAGQTGAYALRLDREAERLAKYQRIAPLTHPGDLLVMDFLTLHASGRNISERPRWTMQWRLFNFADPVGIKIGWRGSFAAGARYQDVLPELVAANVKV